MTPVALLAPLADAAWPEGLEHLRDGFAGGLNVYRTMAHHPALLAAWERLRNHLVLDSALAPDLREIIILRVGHRWASRYEWAQHVVRGRKAGLSDNRIAACQAALPQGPDALLIAAVDTLLERAHLGLAQVISLEAAIGRPGLFDLMATVGMYTTLAFIANSFETPIEPAIAAELKDRPLAAAP